MLSVNVHQMRVEAHARNGSVWLDVLPPQGQAGMYPRFTVFIETENLFALTRELEEIAGRLAPHGADVEDGLVERLPASSESHGVALTPGG